MKEMLHYFYVAKASMGIYCTGLVKVPKNSLNPASLAWDEAKDSASQKLERPFVITEFRRID